MASRPFWFFLSYLFASFCSNIIGTFFMGTLFANHVVINKHADLGRECFPLLLQWRRSNFLSDSIVPHPSHCIYLSLSKSVNGRLWCIPVPVGIGSHSIANLPQTASGLWYFCCKWSSLTGHGHVSVFTQWGSHPRLWTIPSRSRAASCVGWIVGWGRSQSHAVTWRLRGGVKQYVLEIDVLMCQILVSLRSETWYPVGRWEAHTIVCLWLKRVSGIACGGRNAFRVEARCGTSSPARRFPRGGCFWRLWVGCIWGQLSCVDPRIHFF